MRLSRSRTWRLRLVPNSTTRTCRQQFHRQRTKFCHIPNILTCRDVGHNVVHQRPIGTTVLNTFIRTNKPRERWISHRLAHKLCTYDFLWIQLRLSATWGTPGLWHVDGHTLVSACQFLSVLASASYDNYAVSVDRCRVSRWLYTDGSVHLVEGRLLQRCTGGPSETWPWPTAVRHQCCCSLTIWPRYAAAERLTLVACTWTNYIQVVCSRLTDCTVQRHATYKKSHSACRWSHFTTSTAVIFICPAGAGNATYHNWWPSVCRRWASCLERPTRLHHRQFVIAHFQTISQDLSIQSIILST